MLAKLVIFDLDDTLVHEGFENYNEHLLCNDVLNVLEDLKRNGHLLAIASHNEDAENIAKKCGISHFFDIIVGSDTYSKLPLVEEILEFTKKTKDDIVFFDDLYENINELHRNGIKAKKVNWKIGVTKGDILEINL